MNLSRLLDVTGSKQLDTLKLVLLYAEEFHLLPELYDIFGKETLFKFLDIFSGVTFAVPPMSVINKAVRDVSIYVQMKDAPVRAAAIKHISDSYGLGEDIIVGIYSEIDTMVRTRISPQFLRRGKVHVEADTEKGSVYDSADSEGYSKSRSKEETTGSGKNRHAGPDKKKGRPEKVC